MSVPFAQSQRAFSSLAVALVLALVVGATASAQTKEIDDLRAQRDEVQQEKLNLAREYDPVFASIEQLREKVAVFQNRRNEQDLELLVLEQEQEAAKAYAAQLEGDIAELQTQVDAARDNLVEQAIYEYVRPSGFEQIMESNDFNITEKRETLLASANGTELDTIEGFRQAQANLSDLIEESDRASADAVEAKKAVEQQIAEVDRSIVELEDAEVALQKRLEGFFSEQAALEAAEAQTVSLLTAAIDEENQRLALIEQQRIAEERRRQAEEQARLLAEAQARAAAQGVDRSASDVAGGAFAELIVPSQPAPPFNGSMQSPISAPITSNWGMRVNPVSGVYKMHDGVDFGAPSGTPIQAAATGTVIAAGNAGDGYGNKVILDHGGGTATLYAHQSSVAVSVGQKVGQGEVLGYVGSTGNSTGAHLHFEVRINGTSYDPLGYI